jgi:hypothetical protein
MAYFWFCRIFPKRLLDRDPFTGLLAAMENRQVSLTTLPQVRGTTQFYHEHVGLPDEPDVSNVGMQMRQ